jgi:hypothetical protein
VSPVLGIVAAHCTTVSGKANVELEAIASVVKC